MVGPEHIKQEDNSAVAGGERRLRRLTVRVPGSTANLGPGFDAMALALNLHCTLNFDLLEKNDRSIPLIRLKGVLTEGLPKDQNNLIYTILNNLWSKDRELLNQVRITIESRIPLGKGLGSSAAAIVGAVWAAYALSDAVPDNGMLLAKATELEGHADNVSASLLGGLTICSRSMKSSRIVTQKLGWPPEWRPIVVVPPYVLSTKKARSVLPKTVNHQDAVSNVQHVALMMAAVSNNDEEALQEALHDRLHEPYRLELVPELGEVRKLLADFPILGCVLSGAGSSVLVLVHQRHQGQVMESLRQWAATKEEPPEVLSLEVDQEGARVFYE
jgi:homoserine kinase